MRIAALNALPLHDLHALHGKIKKWQVGSHRRCIRHPPKNLTLCMELYREQDMLENYFTIKPIGVIHSELIRREDAPRQGFEGAPNAWLEVSSTVAAGLDGIVVGKEFILVTWFHKAHRDILKLHPRRDENLPLTGVFATRSPDRPNPIGLHRVTVLEIAENKIKVGPLEAIDGTPIVDIKPVLRRSADS